MFRPKKSLIQPLKWCYVLYPLNLATCSILLFIDWFSHWLDYIPGGIETYFYFLHIDSVTTHTRCGGLPVPEGNKFSNWSVNTLLIDPINTNALSQKACLIHAENILCHHCTSRRSAMCLFSYYPSSWCIRVILYWVLFEFELFELLCMCFGDGGVHLFHTPIYYTTCEISSANTGF